MSVGAAEGDLLLLGSLRAREASASKASRSGEEHWAYTAAGEDGLLVSIPRTSEPGGDGRWVVGGEWLVVSVEW